MTIRNPKAVKTYAEQHSDLLRLLDHVTRFVNAMPAPNDAGTEILNINFGYLRLVDELHTRVTQASEIVEELQEGW